MDLQSTARRASVKGSSSGIGTAIARMRAEEGCKVVVHGRCRERAEKGGAGIKAITSVNSVASQNSTARIPVRQWPFIDTPVICGIGEQAR